MARKSSRGCLAALAVQAALLPLLLGGYIAGYFGLSKARTLIDPAGKPYVLREFSTVDIADFYYRAGKMEAWWIGGQVELFPNRERENPYH